MVVETRFSCRCRLEENECMDGLVRQPLALEEVFLVIQEILIDAVKLFLYLTAYA